MFPPAAQLSVRLMHDLGCVSYDEILPQNASYTDTCANFLLGLQAGGLPAFYRVEKIEWPGWHAARAF
jgi:hypothetical protein